MDKTKPLTYSGSLSSLNNLSIYLIKLTIYKEITVNDLIFCCVVYTLPLFSINDKIAYLVSSSNLEIAIMIKNIGINFIEHF